MVIKSMELPTSGDLFPIPAQLSDSISIMGSDWLAPLVSASNSKVSLISSNDSESSVRSNSRSSNSAENSELSSSSSSTTGRVFASGVIPQGAMTIQIEPWLLLGTISSQQISVGITSFGTLDLDKKSKSIWTQNTHWIRALRLSDDCHTYNVQLKFQPSYRIYANIRSGVQPKLVLQTVKPIEVGQELQLWFSEDILAMLQVVFLSLSNIQGENKYSCTRCSAVYESPNPLKLHITLQCGKQPISTLWERLAALVKDPQAIIHQAVTKVKDFDFKLTTTDAELCKQRNALDLTFGTPSSALNKIPNKEIFRPFNNESSAFKPFNRKSSVEAIENTPILPTRTVHQDLPAIWPLTFETDVVQLHRNLMHNQTLNNNAQNIYNDDAQIESLVSSLGKAKQGHICLYCGKCYSRKYGLKIHIRTHTGYKPLRCKFCERPFGDPSNLNKHVRLHAEGNTPYKCELCGKILVRRRDLERHLKSRHMVEMNPGQNIIQNSPSVVGENSNSLSTAESVKDSEDLSNSSKDFDNEQHKADYSNKDDEADSVITDDLDIAIVDVEKDE